MTALDIVVFLLIGWLAFKGFRAGFTTEMLSLGAWVLVIAALKMLHGPVTTALTGIVGTKAGAAVLAFSIIFGLAMFGGKMIARKVGEQSKDSALGIFDRILGAGFGGLKGLIGASIIFLFISLIYNTVYGRSAPRPPWMTQSTSYPMLSASAKSLVDLVEEQQKRGQASPNTVKNAGD